MNKNDPKQLILSAEIIRNRNKVNEYFENRMTIKQIIELTAWHYSTIKLRRKEWKSKIKKL